MNIWQITAIIYVGACVVLAFLVIRVLEQREQARRRAYGMAEDRAAALAERDKLREEIRELYNRQNESLKTLEKQWDDKEREFEALRSARNVAWTKPAKRMPANEVKRAFALDAAAPIWIALHQELDDFLQDQFDQVSLAPSATMTEQARLHLAGGIEQIRQFQKRLLELHAAASKADADLEDEDEKKATP